MRNPIMIGERVYLRPLEAADAEKFARDEAEARTLARVHAGEGERLACQARVFGAGVAVTRLLPPFADADAARYPQDWDDPSRSTQAIA